MQEKTQHISNQFLFSSDVYEWKVRTNTEPQKVISLQEFMHDFSKDGERRGENH